MACCFGYQPPESFLKLVEDMRKHGKKDIQKWIERKNRKEAERRSKRVTLKREEEKEEGEISEEEDGLPAEIPCNSSESNKRSEEEREDGEISEKEEGEISEEEDGLPTAEIPCNSSDSNKRSDIEEEKEEGEISETEEGEISDVTEEHGLPETPCKSSDSLNIRSPVDSAGIDSKKRKSEKEMTTHELYDALTTGWTPPPLKKFLSEPEDLGLPETPCKSSNSLNTRSTAHSAGIDSKKRKRDKEMTTHELYDALTTGWTPPPLKKFLSEPEDLGWLFGSRKTDGQRRSGSEAQHDGVSCAASAGHSAQRSGGVLVHALPYTVPF